MNNNDFERERRKQRRLEKLGSNNPLCGMCGESDDRTLELHHVAGRKHDETVAILCRNCHRKVSDDQSDHPATTGTADPLLASIGNFLLGLADMLAIIVSKLCEFGHDLIARSSEPKGEVA